MENKNEPQSIKDEMEKSELIDNYIKTFPVDIQLKLEEIRTIIIQAAPEASEIISYKMPAYKQHEILVYFAGYKSHIGFYPTANGIATFIDEIKKYKYAKGSVQFPLNEELPKALITKIVKFRIQESILKLENKKTKKK